MANIVIKTKLLDDTEIAWDKRWIKNIEIRMQSSTDASQINYGIVPSSGTIKLVDIDGSIKEYIETNQMAKSNLRIQVYVNGLLVHTLISSNSMYSTTDNTLEITLSSVLSKFDKMLYEGHRFSQVNAFSLLCEILSVGGYSENDVENMTSNTIISNNNFYTISNYLKSISIGHPKVSQMTVAQAINMICGLSQTQCIEDEYGEPKFISGTSSKRQNLGSIVYIPANNQYSDFDCDLFVDNKIEQVKVNYNEFETSETMQNVATYPVKVYNGNDFVATDTNYNPLFPSGQLGSSGTVSTTYRGVVTNRFVKKQEDNVVPDSIDSSFVVKVSSTFSGGTIVEDDISSRTWNQQPQNSSGYISVNDSEMSTLFFNVYVRDNSGGMITRQNVNDFTVNAYKKTYSFVEKKETYGNDSENNIEISNSLFRPSTVIGQTPIYQIIKNNILSEYSNGLLTATTTVSFADYYNLNNTKIINSNNGEMFRLGQVVKIQNDNKYWEITGIRFRKIGVPMLDLEMREANVLLSSAYSLSKGISTVTRTYSPSGASTGALTNSDPIYEGDVLTITYSGGVRSYTITNGETQITGSDLDNLEQTITVSGNVLVSITAKQWHWVSYKIVSEDMFLSEPTSGIVETMIKSNLYSSILDNNYTKRITVPIKYHKGNSSSQLTYTFENSSIAPIYVDTQMTSGYDGIIIRVSTSDSPIIESYPDEVEFQTNDIFDYEGDRIAVYKDSNNRWNVKRVSSGYDAYIQYGILSQASYLTQIGDITVSQYEYS